VTDLANVIDFARFRAARLGARAQPLGIEVRVARTRFALYGPDRGLFLYRDGMGARIRWLTYDEASAVLERHLAAASSP
jgi:hypothetical protein